MKDFIKFPLVLMIICIVCGGIVAITYQITNPVLEARIEKEKRESFEKMYGTNLESFEIKKEDVNDQILAVYEISLKDGKTEYAFETSENGRNGAVVSIITYDENGNITNLDYVSQGETPGIGNRILDDSFINTVVGQNASNYAIDTLTGATISSTAVINSVKASSELFLSGEYK